MNNEYALRRYEIYSEKAATMYARAREYAAHWTTAKQAAFWQKEAAGAAETARAYAETFMSANRG
jgi:hypothetical protein